MKSWQIFRNDNDWNEKTILGAISFAIMVLTAVIDISTGLMGIEFIIHQYIYNSFVIVTLGSFGIAGAERFSSSARLETEYYIQRDMMQHGHHQPHISSFGYNPAMHQHGGFSPNPHMHQGGAFGAPSGEREGKR